MKNQISRSTRIIHTPAFQLLLSKWDAFVVSFVAIGYGVMLFKNPNILDYSKAYDILSQIFTSRFFGVLFMMFGILKIISIWKNSRWLKILSISFMVALWVLFGMGLLLSEPINTLFIHSFGWAAISFGVIIRERMD